MNCKKCGNEIKEGNEFCTNCGHSLNKTKFNKLKEYKIPIIIITAWIVIMCIIAGIKFINNKEDNSNISNDENLKSIINNISELENNIEEPTKLLDEIYTKYPELKDKEIICYNGDGEYWLLDSDGNKMYFDSLESFETAKERCGFSENNNSSHEINTNTSITTDSNNSNIQISEAEFKYEQVKKGMTYYQVYSILGKPQSSNNSSTVKNCFWTISGKVIVVQFINDVVYQKIFNENESNESKKLDPETKRLLSLGVGYPLEQYTEYLDEWGVKYKIVQEENFDFEDNVVTNIEPNDCYIDTNTLVTLTISKNTYDMNIIVDTFYLLKLSGIDLNNYDYDNDNIKLKLKINDKSIFDGETRIETMLNAKTLGNIKGSTTDTYNIEVVIEGIKVQKNINYNIMGDKEYKNMYIYEGGDIGGG